MVLGKFTNDADDKLFIERTDAAMDRVDNDDEEWLSADDFLKELETWQIKKKLKLNMIVTLKNIWVNR